MIMEAPNRLLLAYPSGRSIGSLQKSSIPILAITHGNRSAHNSSTKGHTDRSSHLWPNRQLALSPRDFAKS
jgi:hypothetical protein